jgi:hypothetical protein
MSEMSVWGRARGLGQATLIPRLLAWLYKIFMNTIPLNECDLLAHLRLRHLSLADVPGVHLPH